MKTISDSSIDMILTDPPYGIKYVSRQRNKTTRYAMLKNDDNNSRFLAYAEFSRILKENRVAAIFSSWKNFADDFAELKKYFDVKNVIIWSKGDGGMGDLRYALATDYEMVTICHKGKCKIRGKRCGSIWQIPKVNPNRMLHPTQKPVELMTALIEKYTDVGDVIFDGYAGSGTVAVAAIKTGRNFLGCEIDPVYLDVATKRVSEAQ